MPSTCCENSKCRNALKLHIKNPEAYRLARAIADETNESLTKVVIDALRDRYAQLDSGRAKSSLDELMAIAHDVSRSVVRPYADHDELLYDQDGIPN